MRLLQDLERRIAAEQSMFQAQLLREDVTRLRRLRLLAGASADRDAFAAAARRVGWTQGDQRTHELHSALDPFLDAVFDYERGVRDEAIEDRIAAAWADLTRLRLERLVGCLSNPPPRP